MNIAPVMKQIQVIPGFREVMGRIPTEQDLMHVVCRYPVTEWLSYLSRFQNMLGGGWAGDPERIRAVFYGALSQELRERIAAFVKRLNASENVALFYERQISTLQQYVILHVSSAGHRTFDSEAGRHDLGCALLMIFDLMDSNRRSDSQLDETLACLLQDRIRTSMIPAEQFAGRALHFYDLRSEEPKACIANYLELYERATGVSARDAILGGLCEVIRERPRDLKVLAHGWHPVPSPDRSENPLEARVLRASARVRWRSLAGIRKAIHQLDGHRSIRDWNLIALSKYPIVDLREMGAFVLNHTALGRSLFDGVRHSILTAALDMRLPEAYRTPAAVGSLYGGVFQNYITNVLRSYLGDRVIEIPEGPERRCDLSVSYPDKVILIEIKAEHFLAKDHAAYLTISQRHDELCEIGIPKAVDQLVSTIGLLRSGKLSLPGMPAYDWTTTPIIPLIVTEEMTPQVPGLWKRLYEPFHCPLKAIQGAGPIGRLRFLSIDEVETLPEIESPLDLATLLYRWASHPSYCELAWGSYLGAAGIRTSGRFMRDRFFEVMTLLAERLGLDASQLRHPDRAEDKYGDRQA